MNHAILDHLPVARLEDVQWLHCLRKQSHPDEREERDRLIEIDEE